MEKKQLVGPYEIAHLAGVSRQAVISWRRRYPSFPRPLAELHAGPVFDWADIEAWLDSRRTPMFEAEPTLEVQRHLVGIPPAAQQAFRAARDVLRALGPDVYEVPKARYVVYRRGRRNFVSLTPQQKGVLVWVGPAEQWNGIAGVYRNRKDATCRIDSPVERGAVDQAARLMRRAYELAQ